MWAFNTGAEMVLSGISSFIIASAPIFTLILSIKFLKEKTSPLIWIGVLLSFFGIIIIGVTQVNEMQVNMGVWLLLIAAISTSIYNIIQKHILVKYTAMQATTYSIAFGTLFMCVFIPSLIRELPTAPLEANIVVVYLGIFPAALAYLSWGYALSKAEKTVYVTSFLYLVPFLASIMAFLWLDERMPPLAFVGGAIVVAGMILVNIIKLKPNRR